MNFLCYQHGTMKGYINKIINKREIISVSSHERKTNLLPSIGFLYHVSLEQGMKLGVVYL